ncbi:MAG TPA: hypothetical protein VFV99_26760 [Kofleriaceae bacterium]|nr:hypothetical protein [Kofleriaceae bacterium]
MRPVWVLMALAACGSSMPAGGDAGGDGNDANLDDANDICSGQCKNTSVALMFQTNRTLDSAYYGTTFDATTLRIEAYRKANPGCPTTGMANPDYKLILGEVNPATPDSNMSTANIVDLKGDLLGGPLGLAATGKQITLVAAVDGSFIAVDVMLTFSSGTAMGHIYATHCATLDM